MNTTLTANARHLTLLCLLAVPCTAQQILQPTAATTSLRQLFGFRANNLINQSGFAVPYVSGVTDFANFVAQTTHAGGNANALLANSNGQNQPNGVVNLGETITLDLGQAQAISAIAIWNSIPRDEALLGFELFADDDGDFTNGTNTTLGSFAVAATRAGQAFNFNPVTTQFVHLQITAHGGGDFLRLSELAFRSALGVTNTITHSGNFVGGVAYDPVSDEASRRSSSSPRAGSSALRSTSRPATSGPSARTRSFARSTGTAGWPRPSPFSLRSTMRPRWRSTP